MNNEALLKDFDDSKADANNLENEMIEISTELKAARAKVDHCCQMQRLGEGKQAKVTAECEQSFKEYDVKKIRIWDTSEYLYESSQFFIDFEKETMIVYSPRGIEKKSYKWSQSWVGGKMQLLI